MIPHAKRLFSAALLGAILGTAQPAPLAAQSLFSPAAEVNAQVVTNFEVAQRAEMLKLFRAPGDPRQEAVNALINERLQMQEAKRLGIALTEQEVLEGMDEFAARADLSREEFLQVLAGNGVEAQAFRDFVAAGVAWRKVVAQKFRPRVNVTPDQIDRAIDRQGRQNEVRVSLAEIIIPANTPEAAARAEALAAEISRIESTGAFAAAARQYSVVPSKDRGGAVEPRLLSELPPAIGQLLIQLDPGEVTSPVQIPNAVALFQLRGLEELETKLPPEAVLDYAALYLPGGRSPEALAEAARIDARVDSCDDLYGIAQGLPENQLERDSLPLSQVPTDVALELGRLDPGESSTALTRAGGQTLVYLMLCRRSYGDPETADRQAVGRALTNQMLGKEAEAYLAELRANAHLVIN